MKTSKLTFRKLEVIFLIALACFIAIVCIFGTVDVPGNSPEDLSLPWWGWLSCFVLDLSIAIMLLTWAGMINLARKEESE